MCALIDRSSSAPAVIIKGHRSVNAAANLPKDESLGEVVLIALWRVTADDVIAKLLSASKINIFHKREHRGTIIKSVIEETN